MGIRQMVVAINKMDDKLVNYSEERYNEVKKEISTYLKKIGYNPDKINFVPISGWTGENLVTRSENMPWYYNSGNKFNVGCPTLVEALDSIEPPKR